MSKGTVENQTTPEIEAPAWHAAAASPAKFSSDRRAFSLVGDPGRVLRAIATNLIARVAPGPYVRLTGQTGRDAATKEGASDIAQYFRESVDDYFAQLGLSQAEASTLLSGKVLMEYGPGDFPGVAALMIAKGARKVYCVDRFPMMKLSDKNARVIADLLDHCEGEERERLLACLADPLDPTRGFLKDRIEYIVRPNGLSGLKSAVDLVYSRAVLEHVNDLEATFRDMVEAMRSGALAIHQVDLRSHGLHTTNPLDFLAWSPRLWNAMYSHKGVPNRLRVDRYREAVSRLPIDVIRFEPTYTADPWEVSAVKPLLAAPFNDVSEDDLAWLALWLVMRKK